MLKDRIVILDPAKKSKLTTQETYYQKIKLIGEGTFGKVYLTKHKQLHTTHALKEVLQDPKYKNRELSIISRVQHCNIVYMQEYFLKLVKDVIKFIVSSVISLLSWTTFLEQRKKKRPFPPVVRKLFTFQLFKALYYMQLTNICHRDMKPPNILINNQTYQLKICDFGSAKIIDKEESNVAYICSRYYRAPELVMQATDYRTEIDVWSTGCIIVELLTLEPIFPGDSSQQQLIEIIKILGTPPQRYLDLYQNSKNTEYNLPDIKPTSWQYVLQKYEPQKELVDIISRMLTYNAKERLQPLEGLKHPYFADLHTYKEFTQQLPMLFYFKDLENSTNGKAIEQLEKMYPQREEKLPQKKGSQSIQETLKKQQTPNTCNE